MNEPSIGYCSLGDVPLPELLQLAKLADQSGLSTVWFSDEPYYRSATEGALAAAMVTHRIRIGLGMLNPYDNPPVWMARDLATLQEITGPRAVLAVGAGSQSAVQSQGMTWDRPLAALADTIRIVRELANGQVCHHTGEKFQVKGIKLSFTPTVADPVIFVAAKYQQSVEQAGAIADGLIVSRGCPPSYLAAARRSLQRGAAQAGRSLAGFQLVQITPTFVGDDGDAARCSMKRFIAGFITSPAYDPETPRVARYFAYAGIDPEEFAAVRKRLEAGEKPEGAIPDAFANEFSIAGTPTDCLDLLAAYKHEGLTELLAYFPPWADRAEQIATLGRKLVPEWPRL